MQIVPFVLKTVSSSCPQRLSVWNQVRHSVFMFLEALRINSCVQIFLQTSQNKNWTQYLGKSLKHDTATVLASLSPYSLLCSLVVLAYWRKGIISYWRKGLLPRKGLELCSSCKSQIKTHKKVFVIHFGWQGDLCFPVQLELQSVGQHSHLQDTHFITSASKRRLGCVVEHSSPSFRLAFSITQVTFCEGRTDKTKLI